MQTMLETILADKRKTIQIAKEKHPLDEFKTKLRKAPALRDFKGALAKKIHKNKPAVIAEIKRASPSKGLIRENISVAAVAKNLSQHGATCLSVLTEGNYFLGSNEDLIEARNACPLPVLRKDFIIDEYQIYESRFIGADCVLLIVSALQATQLKTLYQLSKELGLSVLLEVHNAVELAQAKKLSSELIGINNRNLHDFSHNIQITLDLMPSVPQEALLISESGIAAKEEVQLLMQRGVYGFLIGGALMAAENPGEHLSMLIS